MRAFFQNRKIAITALVLAVVLSVTAGINISVGRLSRNVEEVYSAGDTKYGSVKNDITKLSSCISELLAFTTDSAQITLLYETNAALMAFEESPFESSSVVVTACDTMVAMYNRMLNSEGITEEQSKNIILSLAEIEALEQRLKNNQTYNEVAGEYNEVLDSFPANILDFVHKPAAVFN